jgi:hypothetical protein
MPTKAFLATTALVLCVSSPLAGQETGKPAERTIAFKSLGKQDSNAQFVAWYGRAYHVSTRNGGAVLYDQSASSGFAKYAIPSWMNDSGYGYTASGTLAADDFIIPGSGTHTISTVYAAGVESSAQAFANVIFFDNIKYNKKTGTTTAMVKAQCPYMPITDTAGDLTVDVSTCNSGRFKASHDYAVSVQAESAGGAWYWQTNQDRVGRPGFWYDYGGIGNGSCYHQLTPIKICYPTKGWGPDLAFALYGN